ncbi:MAG: pyridoxamine 5'-phosphate oxidase family protein [Candidatus Promineifilaceae bacterium]
MAKQFDSISEKLSTFIAKQPVYFIASAAPDGRVNVSPKGGDTLRVLGPNRVAWLQLTGSGNETAAHLREINRLTIMFCSFEGPPMILRLYGHGTITYPSDAGWEEMAALFPATPGARQIFDCQIEMVQTSCGFAVPFMDFVAERDTLTRWSENRGEDGLRQYWEDRNTLSIDGKETGMREKLTE